MFDKRIKIILAGLLFITAIWQFIENNIGNGIFLCLITGIVVGLYFKNEMLLWAFLKLRKQDMQGTSAILDKIKDPEKSLVTKQQGYYNFLKGIISSQTNLSLIHI